MSLIVLWRVFTPCNLDCGFCGYAKSQKMARKAVAMDEIERMGEIFSSFRQATGRDVLVSWLGGEPLLWPDVAQASALYAGMGLSVSLTTNGTRLSDPETRKFVLKHLSELTVSLDVSTEVHDRYRGAGNFESVAASLASLIHERKNAAAQVKIRVNAILMNGNTGSVSDFIRQLDSMGVDEVTFNELGGQERPEFWPRHRLQPYHVEEALAQVAAVQPERLKVSLPPAYAERLRASAAGRALMPPACRAIGRFLFIDESGRVGPCSFTSAATGISTQDIANADDLIGLEQKFNGVYGSSPCRDCKSTFNFAKFGEAA